MQANQLTTKKGWLAILFLGQLLLSLNDFYFSSLRFPIVSSAGMMLFVLATLALPRPLVVESARKKHLTTLLGLGLCILFFLSALWGLVAFKSATMKGPVGISLGVLLYCITMLQEDNREYKKWLFQFLNIILAIHLLAWFAQYLSVNLFHTFLDYLKPLTGTASRHNFAYQGLTLPVVRYTGLFAEPAAYATFIFTGIAVRMLRSEGKLKLFDALLIASILNSAAITGFFLVFILLGIWGLRALRVARWWTVLALLICIPIGAVIIQSDWPIIQVIMLRLQTPSSDASVQVRTQDALDRYTSLPEPAQVLGVGFGNYDLSEKVSNGILNLLISLGILGAPFVSVVFVCFLRQRSFPWTVWLFLLATLPFAPPFTTQNWWLWIGLMVLVGQDALQSHPKRQGALAGTDVFSARALPE